MFVREKREKVWKEWNEKWRFVNWNGWKCEENEGSFYNFFFNGMKYVNGGWRQLITSFKDACDEVYAVWDVKGKKADDARDLESSYGENVA